MTLGTGTSALEWLCQARLQGMPHWTIPSQARVLVVSPHPDDETLGAGGVISMLVRRGCDVEVLALSDGEAAFPDATARERSELARVRRSEQDCAVMTLGLHDRICKRFYLPDGQLSKCQI